MKPSRTSRVRKRLVVAGLIAPPAAALARLARVFARRIHHLERAANRIAGGRFDEPVGLERRRVG